MLHSDTRDTSVLVGFDFGSLDIKILNSFGYLINFGSGLVLLFRIRFGSVLRIRLFYPALSTPLSDCNMFYGLSISTGKED